jgi:low temperature requirement protein LtrA
MADEAHDAIQTGEEHHLEPEEKVTPLELFFDLVFVFALTQVTSLMSANPTWEGLAQGMLVLAVVWWAWAAYSWLTNTIDPDEYVARISIFAAMVAMFIVALAAPQAFGDYGFLFAGAYFVVRAIHIVLYAYASPSVDITSAVKRFAPGVLFGCTMLVIAATQDGVLQAALWMTAIVFDFTAPVTGGMRGWEVHPAHFAERYGLIMIIAIGESIVAIGVGLEGVNLSFGLLLTASLGMLVAASLWWAYFDVIALAAEMKLREVEGTERAKMARDSYSYIHLAMIAGVILLALGLKKAIGHAHDPLEIEIALALCGGVALYYVGHVMFRERNMGSLNVQRLLAALACLSLIPVATEVDAILTVAALCVICFTLTIYEIVRFRDARERIRGGGLPESMMGAEGAGSPG